MLIRKLAGLACVVLFLFASVGGVRAETWRLGTAAQPGSVLYDVIQDFIADFNAAFADDDIAVEFQFIGNEQEMMQQLIRGRVQIGATSFAGSAVAIPENIVTTVPYLWDSDAERIKVMDEYVIPVLKDIALAKGVVLIDWGDVGWNDVICNFECLTPADLEGKAARMSPVSRHFWQALGANGVQMPLSEFFPGLQQGLVVAGDLPFLYYITTPAAQSAPHYVTTRHLHHGAAWYMNKKLFDGLTDAQRAKLAEVLPPVAETRALVMADEQLPDSPKAKEFAAKGGTIHILTDAQREAFAERVRPVRQVMVDELAAGPAPRAQEVWQAIQKGKADFAAGK
ncbi:TRAP transporter substrate-binding protein [Marinibaculum pumilum]|uniref:TRAP transporter substrate-binding protein n=1 Tax=Marinibaculum pumilum TaxID=1766165 RepID=A0ABV7KVV4_9PROT